MGTYYAGDHGDVATKEAAAVNRSQCAQRERWITKDGREIPYSTLSDQHLLNILRMLQRDAVALAAARTVRMIEAASGPFGPQGEGAQLAFDAEFGRQLDKDWKSYTGPEWAGLMKEARRRPAVAGKAAEVALADLRQAQLAVELRMIGS